MDSSNQFEMQPHDASFFDPKSEVGVLQRRLPHWDQAGTYAFVTFRLIDSLPQQLIQQLAQERSALLSAAGIDRDAGDLKAALNKLPPREASVLRWKLFTAWDELLDSLVGECWLRWPDVSRIVSDGLRKFDGDRYTMVTGTQWQPSLSW